MDDVARFSSIKGMAKDKAGVFVTHADYLRLADETERLRAERDAAREALMKAGIALHVAKQEKAKAEAALATARADALREAAEVADADVERLRNQAKQADAVGHDTSADQDRMAMHVARGIAAGILGLIDAPAPQADPRVQTFPPPSCTAWEDCKHDGICHDPQCGAVGPNQKEPRDD